MHEVTGKKLIKIVEKKEDIRTHKDLEIWELGIDLVELVYSVTGSFPKDEVYGLAAQM